MLLERQHKNQWGVWVSAQVNDRVIGWLKVERETHKGRSGQSIMLEFCRLGASLADVAILLLHAEVNSKWFPGPDPGCTCMKALVLISV